jgi:alanine transaminase
MIGPTRTGSENPTEAKVDATFPPYLPNLDQDYEIKMRFQEFANWLIPGSLMAGRYPFVEPSRCRDRKTGEEMLEALITAGVTTFISLQEEIPPQGEMPLKGVGGFLPYKPAATLIATALSDPPGIDEMNGLRTPYLDKYLPPRKKDVGSARRRRVELDFVHSPITDLGLPGEEQ